MISFDPYDPKQFARLRKAVKHNYRMLKPFRNVRQLLAEAARGHYYNTQSDPPDAYRAPVNMIDQWLQTLTRSFVQATPRARITSRSDPMLGRKFEASVNRRAVEIELRETLRRCIQEAILGYLGIAYTGIAATDLDPLGETFVDSVTLPNFVMDIQHTEFHEADLVGHKFARRIEEMRDSGLYDPKLVDSLTTRGRTSSELDDKRGTSQPNQDEGTIFDWADIWSIHVKPANLVVYMADSVGPSAPLRVESYFGPDFGPYEFLAFDRVLDEMMPNSRGAMMLDMHDFVNGQYTRIFMKEDQAAEFHTYEGGSEEDARRVRDAEDGGLYLVNNNNGVQRRRKGGTNPQSLATAIHARQLFDELSGNLRRTGGVASTAETATEARIDQANTSRLIRDMQLQVIDFTKRIFQNIAWHEWTHPTREQAVEVRVGKNGMAIQDVLTPEQRTGDFVQFEIDVVPDSFEHRSSGQQLEHLMRAIQGAVVPIMGLPSERPVILKGPELLDKYSRLDNLPELEEVVDYATDESFVTRPPGGTPTIPPSARAAAPGGGGGSGAGIENNVVERVLSGAIASGASGDDEG